METYHYYRVGIILVRVSLYLDGTVRCAEMWDTALNDFRIDNAWLSRIEAGSDVTPLTAKAFEVLVSKLKIKSV